MSRSLMVQIALDLFMACIGTVVFVSAFNYEVDWAMWLTIAFGLMIMGTSALAVALDVSRALIQVKIDVYETVGAVLIEERRIARGEISRKHMDNSDQLL